MLVPSLIRPTRFLLTICKPRYLAMSDYPSTIKAIQYSGNGGTEVIQLNDIPFPKPAADEILVKVEWAGVNFIDTYFRTGLYPTAKFPTPVGQEASGIIESLPTDPSILDSAEFKQRGLQVGGKVVLTGLGAFSQYLSRPWNSAISIPSSVTTRDAAALTLQALTAITFVEEAYNIQSGDWILVHAAAGGFGLLLASIIRARGAHVIGTVSTKEKAEVAKAAGADHVIISTEEDVVKKVLEYTGGLGVHAVYDGIGAATWEANFDLIRRKGTIVTLGNASGPVPPFAPLKLSPKNLKVVRPTLNNYLVTPEEKEYYTKKLWDLLGSGVLKVNVFKEYEFTVEGVAQAQDDITGRKSTGKLLIKVAA